MTAVLVHHRLDHHSIADQSLFDDPLPKRCRHNSASTTPARSLLALGHLHEVLGRFHLLLLTDLVTNHDLLLPTNTASTLFRRASNHPFYTWQVRRQWLPARVFLGFQFLCDSHF